MKRYAITLTAANGSYIRRTFDAMNDEQLRDKCIEQYPLHSLTIHGALNLS